MEIIIQTQEQIKKQNESYFIPHLNVQNNSNLGFSLLTNEKIIEFAKEKK